MKDNLNVITICFLIIFFLIYDNNQKIEEEYKFIDKGYRLEYTTVWDFENREVGQVIKEIIQVIGVHMYQEI